MHLSKQKPTENLKFSLALILCSIFMMLITGCGFTPRPINHLPSKFQIISLNTSTPYNSFVLAFKKALQTAGAKLTSNNNNAPVTINILQTDSNFTQINFDFSTATRVYAYTMSATFKITNAQGKTILDTQTVSATRNITLSPNEILNASNQPEIIKQVLQEQVIIKIFNILNTQQI
jgi:outer membrane lipopolysaccharide assembly protein LptE/RlpB